MPIRCVIADDEPIARQIVETYVQQLPQLELVGQCRDAFEVMDMLQRESVDLLFLDINMPQLSGLSLLRTLSNRPNVILTTAYPEHALEGFELAVTDYLLKPFSLERFIMAVNKVQEKLGTKASPTPVQVSPSAPTSPTHLIVKVDKKMVRLALADIRYVEAYGNYIKIYLAEELLVVNQTMSDFLNQLPAEDFIRIHKSYLINFNHLKSVEGNQVQLAGQQLPIGKAFREGVMKRMKGA